MGENRISMQQILKPVEKTNDKLVNLGNGCQIYFGD
jgi:hypothetical protein